MAIYRYLVTIETANANDHMALVSEDLENEIDSNLDSCLDAYGIEHFTVNAIDYTQRDGYRERVIRSNES